MIVWLSISQGMLKIGPQHADTIAEATFVHVMLQIHVRLLAC